MIARLAILMLVRGATYGAFGPFATVLLLLAGLPAALVGPLAAAGAVISLVAAPTWGRLGDRHGRRRLLVVAFVAGAPAALGHASGSLTLLVVAYLAWSATGAAYIPLVDSLVLARLDGDRARYARVRFFASSGYILAAVAAGAGISAGPLGWATAGLLGTALCLAAAIGVAARLGGELRTGTGAGSTEAPGLLDALRGGIGRYGTFLAGLALVYAGANAPSIFTGPRVTEIGGSGWEIGLATAAGTLVELPAFLGLPFVLARLGGRRTFLAGGVLLGVSGVLAAVAPTPALLVAARLLSGAGFAWVVLPSLSAIVASAPADAQAGVAALHFGANAAGSLVVALAGLPLVALTDSVAAVLAVAAIASPIGAVVALRAWPRARPVTPGRAPAAT